MSSVTLSNAALNRWTVKKNAWSIFNGKFLRQSPWEWTTKGDLKVETEALIFAAQEQALRTNYVKINIDMSVDSPLFGCVAKTVKQ